MSEQQKNSPILSDELLQVRDLKMHFPVTAGLLKRTVGYVKAVDGVSLTVRRKQVLGVVGESGSGKSTLGNCMLGMLDYTDGHILYDGRDLKDIPRRSMKQLRSRISQIAQDPFSSMDPRMDIAAVVTEGVRIHHMSNSRAEREELAAQMLELVGINPAFMHRYPHEFSGGQRQRICIARTLALRPEFIVCDEIVSALDVSIQAQIVNLMIRLQKELSLTYVFIGHDLSVVRHISDEIAVMYLGRVMELSPAGELYQNPLHPYTQALISAAPIPDPSVDRQRQRILLQGEVPSPMHPPSGCPFSTRCPYATSLCHEQTPETRELSPGHFAACHYADKGGFHPRKGE